MALVLLIRRSDASCSSAVGGRLASPCRAGGRGRLRRPVSGADVVNAALVATGRPAVQAAACLTVVAVVLSPKPIGSLASSGATAVGRLLAVAVAVLAAAAPSSSPPAGKVAAEA